LRLLVDENVPRSAVEALREAGHDLRCIAEMSPGIPDQEVLTLAGRENRLLLTFDKDFAELVARDKSGAIPGVILCRFRLRSPEIVAKHLLKALAGNAPWRGCFSVVEEHRVRSAPLL